MRGAAGPSYFDLDDNLAHGGQVDLSDAVWSSLEGRQYLEQNVAAWLHGYRNEDEIS
jgi:hypothetical protein